MQGCIQEYTLEVSALESDAPESIPTFRYCVIVSL